MSRLTPDNIVCAAVNEVFEKTSADTRHDVLLGIRKAYQSLGRFHHTYGRLAQNLERVNATKWDNRPAALAAVLFEKMESTIDAAANAKTASDILYVCGRQDLIEGTMALLENQNDRPDSQKFADIVRHEQNDVSTAVDIVAEYIHVHDFSGLQVARDFAQATGVATDDILRKARDKAQGATDLKRDNSFPHVSGLQAKIA